MKKVFIIFLVVFVISGVFLVVYTIKFKPEKGDVSVEKEETETSLQKEYLYPISSEKALGVFIDKAQEKILYYSSTNGNVIEADLDGRNKKIVSDVQINNVEEVKWSPLGKEAIIKIDGKYYYHNLVSKKTTELDGGTDTVSWSGDGKNIIYKYFDFNSGEKSINTSEADGKNWKKITNVEFRDVEIEQISKTGPISFWNKPRASEETALEIIYAMSSEKRKVFSGRFGADYKWSFGGEKALVSFLKDDSRKTLSSGIININGSFTDLGIPTMASKTVWSYDGKILYYATPTFPPQAMIPDDYENGKIGTVDTFWKTDTESGKQERLIGIDSIKTEIDASEMQISPNGRSLIFINKKDGLIYRLDF